jgi:hypothetical protein
MKKLLTVRHILVLPLLLLGPWAGSYAQSLGTPSASVWIGRPLDMTVPTRFASADSRDECVHADVFFGDTRLPPERVRATIIGTDPRQKRVRIETETLIDEPVVTVSVRAGCQSTVTRSYTLLPELASDQVVAALAARPAAPRAAPLSPAMAAAASMAPLQLAADASTSAVTSPRLARATALAPVPAPMKTPSTRRAEPPIARAAAPTGPRLRLEPLDLESHTLLRVSARLAEPAGDASRRATAAMLWQAINADPQEVLRTTVMLQALERDLASVRQASSQTQAEVAALRQRLDAARPWYESTAAVQLLSLLLLVAAATAGVLWHRSRRNEPGHWYAHPPGLSPESAVAADAGAEPGLAEQAVQLHEQVGSPRPMGFVTAAADVPRADFVPSAPEAAPPAGRQQSAPGVLRVETLAATFEEVEFLSSLGLPGDAADVLESYLQDCGSPAPLAFHELMRLRAQEEDPGRAAAVGRRYAQVFGFEPPRLAQVTAPLGLDSMPALSAGITSAWNTPGVLQVIEDALFGTPEAGAPLTLQAGRDLLCLHDLAMNLVTEASSVPGTGDGHAPAPWAHAEDAAGAQLAVQAVPDVDRGGALGVDIDVGAAAARPLSDLPLVDPDVAPMIAELHAAAREAQARVEAIRRQEEEIDAFSAATASERMPLSRY